MKTLESYPDYKIDEYGNVYSYKRKNVIKLKFTISSFGGYYSVNLYNETKKPKQFYVHRLVALSYIPKIEGKNIINHIDGNKLNNNISNLEWCTHSENTKHGYEIGSIISNFSKGFKIKRYSKKIKCFFIDGSVKEYNSITDAANDNSILISTIHNNIKGLSNYCGNKLKFKYNEQAN